MRTSAAIAPLFDANTGFRSISAICGKSETSCDTFSISAGERVAVHRIAAAHALQDRRRADAVEHRQRVGLRGRRQPERDVLQHFDEDAAQSERDQLAERLIRHGADDDFLAAHDHLLHLHALQVGLRVVLLRVGHDRREARLHVGRALDADEHAARFGLVQYFRRHDLQHDREAHAGGELGCFGGRGGDAFLRHGDAVRVAYALAFGRRQRRASVGLCLVQNLLHRRLVVRHRRFLRYRLQMDANAASRFG